MTRKEKKERADKKRLEIAQSLLRYMKIIAGEISDEEMKTDLHRRWKYILTKGDEWINSRMRIYPREAHMYKAAAIMAKNWILEVLIKKEENKNG